MYSLVGTRKQGGHTTMCFYSQGIAPTFMNLGQLTTFTLQKQIVRLRGIETVDITKSLYRFQRLWRRWRAWRRAVRAVATPRYLRARELTGQNLQWELERRISHQR